MIRDNERGDAVHDYARYGSEQNAMTQAWRWLLLIREGQEIERRQVTVVGRVEVRDRISVTELDLG